jgi:hypothetical protein
MSCFEESRSTKRSTRSPGAPHQFAILPGGSLAGLPPRRATLGLGGHRSAGGLVAGSVSTVDTSAGAGDVRSWRRDGKPNSVTRSAV